jgi:hypothetical protein
MGATFCIEALTEALARYGKPDVSVWTARAPGVTNQLKFGGVAVLLVAAIDARIIRAHPGRIELLVKRGVLRRVVMVLRDACRWTRENCGRDQYGRD